MRRLAVATFLSLAAALAAPAVSSACAVTNPLPADVLAADADMEGRAWTHASLVFVGEITGTGNSYDSFELTPRLILKGGPEAPVIQANPSPPRGLCLKYHGLSVEDGAVMGDEFVVYVLTEPVSEGGLYVVSTRMVGDPATRVALQDERRSR